MNAEPIRVVDLLGRAELVGALMGEADLPKFQRAVGASRDQEFTWFDWKDIELATASYLRFAYLGAFNTKQPRVIVTSGLQGNVREDLELVLENKNRAIFEAVRPARRKTGEVSIIGPLDETYIETVELVKQTGKVSARELMAKGDSKIGQTAWNNRLNRLFEMGLLIKEKVGKEACFKIPVIEG